MANNGAGDGRVPDFVNYRRQHSCISDGSCEENISLISSIRELGNKLMKYREFCQHIITTKVPEAERKAVKKCFDDLESTGGEIYFIYFLNH